MKKEYGDSGYDNDFQWGDSGKVAKKKYAPCYQSHPKLIIGGGTLYGGSCSNPVILTADVYVGLDSYMTVVPFEPWERRVDQILYPVRDMGIPSSSKTFKKLVEYLCNQLQDGKTVHAGCIGGHGRTGMLFSAMFSIINEDKDAITSVRKAYCKKAVESSEQVTFLNKYFGINKVDGAKMHSPSQKGYVMPAMGGSSQSLWPKASASELKTKSMAFSDATKVWNCVNSSHKIMGPLI